MKKSNQIAILFAAILLVVWSLFVSLFLSNAMFFADGMTNIFVAFIVIVDFVLSLGLTVIFYRIFRELERLEKKKLCENGEEQQ